MTHEFGARGIDARGVARMGGDRYQSRTDARGSLAGQVDCTAESRRAADRQHVAEITLVRGAHAGAKVTHARRIIETLCRACNAGLHRHRHVQPAKHDVAGKSRPVACKQTLLERDERDSSRSTDSESEQAPRVRINSRRHIEGSGTAPPTR